MDINLPGISGFEAMRSLLEDPSTAHIPVVALSANAMPHDITRGLSAGFFRYLTKPIKVKEFMETLDLAFRSHRHDCRGPGTVRCIVGESPFLAYRKRARGVTKGQR
jgi:CheY-like chemotaxis protein